MKIDIAGIDVLKALAVTAVILIHVTSKYLSFFEHLRTAEANWNLIFNQIERFSVPLFVALSGFGLARKYLHSPFDLRGFIQRRLWRLLPEYLIWSLIIFLLVSFYFHEGQMYGTKINIFELLIWGKADYHLYFVPMIVVLYSLFPLIFYLMKRLPRIVLLAAAVYQIWWYWLISVNVERGPFDVNLWGDQRQYIFFGSWIFYFVLGIYLAIRPLRLSRFWSVGILVIFSLSITVMTSHTLTAINSGVDLLIATRFTNLPVLVFASLFIVLGVKYFIGEKEIYRGKLLNGLAGIGKLSYGVYLSHTLVVRYLFQYPETLKAIGVVATSLIVIILSFGLIGLVRLVGRYLEELKRDYRLK